MNSELVCFHFWGKKWMPGVRFKLLGMNCEWWKRLKVWMRPSMFDVYWNKIYSSERCPWWLGLFWTSNYLKRSWSESIFHLLLSPRDQQHAYSASIRSLRFSIETLKIESRSISRRGNIRVQIGFMFLSRQRNIMNSNNQRGSEGANPVDCFINSKHGEGANESCCTVVSGECM